MEVNDSAPVNLIQAYNYLTHTSNDSDEHNVTNSTVPQEIDVVSAVFAGTLISIIILLIVFGNLMVIIAAVKDRHLKQALQNRFIVSLAAADMMLGAVIMPLSLHHEILKYWALGAIVCDIWLAMDVFLCTASTLSLVVVSLDRYWSVTKALEYPQLRTSRNVNISIAGIWITSAIVSLPPLAGWKSQAPSTDDDWPQCNLSDDLGYIVYSLTISFYLPLIIILVAYGRIFLVARRRANQKVHLGTFKETNGTDPTSVKTNQIIDDDKTTIGVSMNSVAISDKSNGSAEQSPANEDLERNKKDKKGRSRFPKLSKRLAVFSKKTFHNSVSSDLSTTPPSKQSLLQHSNHKQLRRARNQRGRERRATITIAIIVMAFVICWLPFSVLYLIDRLCLCGIREHIAFSVIFWLGYCNSAVNPVLYSIFNRDFRHAFHRLLCNKR